MNPMNTATRLHPSPLSLASLRALFEEVTQPGDDPRTALLAARSVLNLVYVAEERAMTNYADDPMSDFAPSECGSVVSGPWRSLREMIDARITVLEDEAEAAENEWFSMAEAV